MPLCSVMIPPASLQKSKTEIPREHVKGYTLYGVIPPSNNSTLLAEQCLNSYLIKDFLPSTKWKTCTLSNEQALEILSSEYALSTVTTLHKTVQLWQYGVCQWEREGKEVWGLYPQFLHNSLQTALPAFLLHALPWPLAPLYIIGSTWPDLTLLIKRQAKHSSESCCLLIIAPISPTIFLITLMSASMCCMPLGSGTLSHCWSL